MLQSVVEGIGDPLLLMDGSGNVVLANEAARRLSRSLGGHITDEGCTALFRKKGLFAGCPLQAALESGTSMTREVQTEDGRFFSVNVFPVSEGTPGEGRAVVYVRDVTQEKQMLASMQQSEKLATVGQLAAGLAHEINNPLGVIRCYAELLKGNASGEEQMRDVNVIIKHAAQAENVLQDLLNFARPKKAEPVMLDMGKALENALSVFRVQAEKKNIKLEAIIDDALPPILANEQAVEQIFANLLKNALDAVPPDKGRITASADFDQHTQSIRICVADNGPGIAKEHSKKLFDPFFSTKEVGMGTGLGLAVVYGLVQEMGGTITIKNNGGAVFTIALPVTKVDPNGGNT
jgi:signal transduction histidine kinase